MAVQLGKIMSLRRPRYNSIGAGERQRNTYLRGAKDIFTEYREINCKPAATTGTSRRLRRLTEALLLESIVSPASTGANI
jgi:hypothetical protein